MTTMLWMMTPIPQQVLSIVWCPRIDRFIQKSSPNHITLKLEVEMLHEVDMNFNGNNIMAAKENRRRAMDSTNCLDTGASITLTGKNLMKKMGLNSNNLLKDNTRVSAAEGSTIKVIGFIPVKLKLKHDGMTHKTNEYLYFAEGVLTILVSLGALKNLKCISEQFPYPATESASSLTESDYMDDDEEEEEKEVKARQPTPPRPEQLPYPPMEENMPRLKAWLIERFSTSSFNTSSAPLAKMLGPPIKIHINPEAN